jgi:hypothetical protein
VPRVGGLVLAEIEVLQLHQFGQRSPQLLDLVVRQHQLLALRQGVQKYALEGTAQPGRLGGEGEQLREVLQEEPEREVVVVCFRSRAEGHVQEEQIGAAQGRQGGGVGFKQARVRGQVEGSQRGRGLEER